ncbi:MAG: helix-turn-helix domain-containing protein, partial [Verrucomicrobiota bacterium]|nr:helix-turn-helix domain-containing protein [Verrucomicrobiota bacterium]
MAFGEILRNARVQKGLTPSDVAESTHMLVQVVESLEQEDFRRIAAPIYGRGFVKLYAELLELDPEPLVSDFMNLYGGGGARVSAVLTKKVEAPPEEPAPAPVAAPVVRTVSGVAAPHVAVSPRPPVAVRAVPA